jgi:malonate transporter and related proteins
MQHPVITALLPVVLLIAVGFAAGKRGLVELSASKALSNLMFSILLPPLLFRTMVQSSPEHVQLEPVLIYLGSMVILFVGVVMVLGFNQRGVILGLASSYGNTVMIGIALIGFAYGPAGQAVLFSLISVHAVLMLTFATLMLEGLKLRKLSVRTALQALRAALRQPTTWPILLGLAYKQTGLNLPMVIDRPLMLLGQAFSPMALVMVGLGLSSAAVMQHWRGALLLSGLKNLLQPLLVLMLGYLIGVQGLALTVMVVAASLPMGANVFIFSQRYDESQDLISTSVSLSTLLAMLSVSLTMSLMPAIT